MLAPIDAAARAGLAERDYRAVIEQLGREPNPIEARMFGVMWSEHCGYKHSKQVLRRLPSASPRVLTGAGENAGVVRIGGGWALAFKMESHNHPSAVDPYNGAATGVGGIIRDVLAMGARPVALLDSLRFGPLAEPRSRRLCGGVVAGIAGYGNAIGVPTVGGELLADPCYRDNPLVNVACLGLVPERAVATSAARGPGNVVLYVGARTGRDGIGGAAFASVELDEGREAEDRASVQMGDPFTGKSLIEATLEAWAGGGIVAMQDMGAAGLTCAACEMAARGGVGMTLDLDRVPLREAGMRAEEILLSESQERMLLVVSPHAAVGVAAHYHRWGLAAEAIGVVTAEQRLLVRAGGREVVDLPPDALASAPAYDPAAAQPAGLEEQWALEPSALPHVRPADALLGLLATPDVASKRAVFEQYDYMVGVRTVVPPGAADAAVLRIIDAPPLGLALVADGNARWCASDPRRGAMLIALEAAANLACVGAEPIAVTDCLNFGNPERPEVFWTFREAVEGLAEACAALGVPVVGGNVSFYNEPEGGSERAVFPTPVVGMVGLIDHVTRPIRPGFAREGDLVVLIGPQNVSLGASLYLRHFGGLIRGRPATPMVEPSVTAIAFVRQAVREGLLASVHDCADGGLAVALAEACMHGGVGLAVATPLDVDACFGEGPGRFVASVRPEDADLLSARAEAAGVPVCALGTVGGDSLRIADVLDVSLAALIAAWEGLEV